MEAGPGRPRPGARAGARAASDRTADSQGLCLVLLR